MRVRTRATLALVDEATPAEFAAAIRPVRAVDAARALAAAAPLAPEHFCGATTAGDDRFVIFTSGTTGEPKGAVLPHRKTLYNALNAQLYFGIRSGEEPVAGIDLAMKVQAVISLAEIADRRGTMAHFDPETRKITDGSGREIKAYDYEEEAKLDNGPYGPIKEIGG